jgi:hypothetical protein
MFCLIERIVSGLKQFIEGLHLRSQAGNSNADGEGDVSRRCADGVNGNRKAQAVSDLTGGFAIGAGQDDGEFLPAIPPDQVIGAQASVEAGGNLVADATWEKQWSDAIYFALPQLPRQFHADFV